MAKLSKSNTKKRRPIPASHAKDFSDAELRILEREFIDCYSGRAPGAFKIVLKLHKRYIGQLIIAFILYIIATLPHICLPIVTADIINIATEKPDDFAFQVGIRCAFIFGLILLNLPTNLLRTKYSATVERKVEAGLRGALVRKLQQLSIPFHKEMQSGRIQSKLMRDVQTIQTLTYILFSEMPRIIINMVTAMVIVISKSMSIFVFFLMCVPSAIILTGIFDKPIEKNNKAFRKNLESTNASLVDMLQMTQITRAHALENRETHKMTSKINKVANTGYKLDMVYAWFGSASWAIFQLFQILCLTFSAFLVVRGKIGVGDISLYQTYFSMLISYVSTIINYMPLISKGLDSVSSIGEILSADDIEDNKGKHRLPSLEGKYEFKNVHFSYEDDMPILKGLNLSVNKGETIAFVGESGSGKSTLINLILGFNTPNEGEILVDGTNINDLNLYSYRRHLAVVPQNSVLFTGTIRENITYGMDNVSDEKLKSVLDASLLTNFINSLPQGVDTPLEEHGANLSGGQKQRLSIARALIREPDVIIFDEATSALDTISEKEIQKAIDNLSRDKTTFIVAHRLSTIRNADRIAVIKDGVCCECGTYEELCAKKGVFYEMLKPQNIAL